MKCLWPLIAAVAVADLLLFSATAGHNRRCAAAAPKLAVASEETASEGLDIRGYSGKWRRAKDLAAKNERKHDAGLLPYWERARLLFLELGGGYVGSTRRTARG